MISSIPPITTNCNVTADHGVLLTTLTDGSVQVDFAPSSGYKSVYLTFKTPLVLAGTGGLGLVMQVPDGDGSPGTSVAVIGSSGNHGALVTIEAEGVDVLYRLTQEDPASHGMEWPPAVSTAPGAQPMVMNGVSAGADQQTVTQIQIYKFPRTHAATLIIRGAGALPAAAELPAPATGQTLDAQLYAGLVDAYGQRSISSWPGKVTQDADIVASFAAENTWLAAAPAVQFSGRDRDSYGGWKTGPQLLATSRFTVQKVNGRWWLVSPAGTLAWSIGLASVIQDDATNGTITQGRTALFASLPAAGDDGYGTVNSKTTYNFYRRALKLEHGSGYLAAWRTRVVQRLQAWGFNCIGNFSDTALYPSMPFVAFGGAQGTYNTIPTGASFHGNMPDAYDSTYPTALAAWAASMAYGISSSTWAHCHGIYWENELPWCGTVDDPEVSRCGIAIGALGQDASTSPAKTALVAQLTARYVDIGSLNDAWGTSFASWSALNAPYTMTTVPAGAVVDLRNFVFAFAVKYFTLVKAALSAAAPGVPYLGCRFALVTYEAAKASAQVCDVSSYNSYAGITPQLDAWWREFGEPVILSEFGFQSNDRGGIGAPSTLLGSQLGRLAAYQSYYSAALTHPCVVGAHAYQLVDQPITGRPYDNENMAWGWVSLNDQERVELTRPMSAFFASAYCLRSKAGGTI